MRLFSACFLALSLAHLAMAAPLPTSDEVPGILSQRSQVSADALIGKIMNESDPSIETEITTSDPATGLALSKKLRWDPATEALFVDTSVKNTGSAPVVLDGVPLIDWAFQLGGDQDDGKYQGLNYRDDQWYDSTYWTGPGWTRVGKDWHHPGTNTPSVRRFTAPRAGRLTITGRVYKGDTNGGGGDGVRLSIRHRAESVWKGEIDGTDTKGLEPSVAVEVHAGDALRFVVHKKGSIGYDTTHWDPVITYADGERFQASEAFSSKAGGPWSYEMETTQELESHAPRFLAFAQNLDLLDHALTAGKTASLTQEDTLPLLILSDTEDTSGLVVGLQEGSNWECAADWAQDGLLSLRLTARAPKANVLAPGQTLQLPGYALAAYEGERDAGIDAAQRLLEADAFASVQAQLKARFDQLMLPAIDLRLWAQIQADWLQQDKIGEPERTYAQATEEHLDKARALLADLRRGHSASFLAAEAARLEELAASKGDESSRYLAVRALKRAIAFSNPLLDFDQMLFCKRVPTSYSHLVMQYYGWRARAGGSLFVLDKPGRSLATRDIIAGQLPNGNILEPRLSYDGKRIIFSFVPCAETPYDPAIINNDSDDGFYHIYEINVDGTGLRKITDGRFDHVMPTYLPDGGIAFCSTRRKGYARCFGKGFSHRWDTYTLHRMNADGTDMRTLSFNDVNEWFPTVSNTGTVLYARWDYIDRDAVTHQNLWASRPDGTNPMAIWGNGTPSPHCTFQMQPIPNSSKIVFTASAHHSIAGGPIVVVDPTIKVDGEVALNRITPEIPFPEAESRDIQEYYTSPWPLSDKYFLVAYSPKALVWEPGANHPDALGLYLLDAFGNRELIYRDPDIGSTNPCPLRARTMPPVIASQLPANPPSTGEVTIADVYQGLGDIPRDTIKEIRVIQIFPKTTPWANTPPVGLALEENGRAVLGTVPVLEDGSSRFIVPAQKPLLFQALDKDGMAYQTMRSLTYLQPGERVSCVGCHESHMTTPTAPSFLRQEPATIKAGPFDGEPFSYMRVVQPILDKHCVKCHSGEKPKKGINLTSAPEKTFCKSYVALCGKDDFWGPGTNLETAAKALVPRFGGRNQVQITPPGGHYGARGSRLLKMLRKGHSKVKLSDEELRRIAMWIDCNAIFYGVNPPEVQAIQLAGESIPMPELQ